MSETKRTYPREWFYVNQFSTAVEPKMCIGETEHFITISRDGGGDTGRREKKVGDWYSYFPTREEAEAALVAYKQAEQRDKLDRSVKAAAHDLLEALEMVRDADEDCRRDGLRTIPGAARAKIDAAIAKAKGNP